MTLAERSRRRVETRLAVLRERFGEVPLESRTAENDPVFFESGVELVASGVVGAAGAVVTDERGRVLLAYHPEEAVWGPPGGGHEPGETLLETARREVREEASVDVELTGVYRAERKRFVHAAESERRAYLLEVVFTADHVSGTPDASADDEIQDVRWFESEPADCAVVDGDDELWDG